MLGRKKSSSVINRVAEGDLSGSVQALRGHAHDAVDRFAPTLDAAQKTLAPKVVQAREAIAPSVEAAQKAVAPKVESAWAAMAPVLSTAAASALGAAQSAASKTASTADKKSKPSRKEAKRRAKFAAAAIRGEHRRRWPLVFGAFVLGSALGAAAGALVKKLQTPSPAPGGSFTDLTARPNGNHSVSLPDGPAAVPDPESPLTENDDSQDGPAK